MKFYHSIVYSFYDNNRGATSRNGTSVFDICKRHAEGGAKALQDAIDGRKTGADRRLSSEQESEVRRLICDKTPDQLKMPYALWTRNAMSELIEQRFGIRLPVHTMGAYLSRWGFTPQKPIRHTLRAVAGCGPKM